MSDLKPCPFCGSSDVGGASGIISCYRCPAEISVQNTNTHYAAELWNNRAARAQQPNLSRIAQKKLDQMGATVHGVLVKNGAGAWVAVSDAGRVMWLDGFEGQAARQAPASGEVEPVMELDISEDRCFSPILIDATLSLPAGHYELYTHPPAKVPEVCDGKEQEAFELYAARMGYDMTEHPLHYLFLSDRTSTARDAWKAAISYCHEVLTTPTPATTPRPADNWIKCSDRLPTEADADMYGKVWCFLPNRQEPRVTQFGFKEAAFFYNRDCTVTHWMTTGLKHPNPPAEGAE